MQEQKHKKILKFEKQNKIKFNVNCLFELSYKQLKAIYNYFELKNHHYKEYNEIENLIRINWLTLSKTQKEKELPTWIMNIKNIYELINKNFFFKPKFTFYFEYILPSTKRIDILVKNKNKELIIECSHNYTDELLNQKENQAKIYQDEYQQLTNLKINKVVYINDNIKENETIKNTIKALKELN